MDTTVPDAAAAGVDAAGVSPASAGNTDPSTTTAPAAVGASSSSAAQSAEAGGGASSDSEIQSVFFELLEHVRARRKRRRDLAVRGEVLAARQPRAPTHVHRPCRTPRAPRVQLPPEFKHALLIQALETCGPSVLAGLEAARDAILYAASRCALPAAAAAAARRRVT
jgi:hypothetical protein